MDLNEPNDGPSSSNEDNEARLFRKLGARDDIKDTANLIDAYNFASDDVERRLLLRWIREYIRWFRKQDDFDITETIVGSYTKLARIQSRSREDGELMKRFLFSLVALLNKETFCSYNIIAALEHVLTVIDPVLLEDNDDKLIDLIPVLLSHLDPTKRRFTKRNYMKHAVTLFALHQVVVVLETFAPGQLTEEIFQDLLNTVKKVEESDEYYPYVFYGRLVKHSIKNFMKHNGLGPWVRLSRRVFHGVCGSLCALQGLRAIAQLDYDFAAFESAVHYFMKAFGHLERDKWTKTLTLLLEAAVTSIEKDDYDYFKSQWIASMNEGRRWWKEKNRKMRGYCVISQLRMIAVEGRSDEIRNQAVDEILSIIVPTHMAHNWLREPHLFEAMLDALHAIHVKGEHRQRTADAIGTLTTAVVDNTLKEKAQTWIGRRKIEDVLNASLKLDKDQDVLFLMVKDELGLDETSENRKRNLQKLRDCYTSDQFTKVRTILDEREYRNIEEFEYHIVRYEEVVSEMPADDERNTHVHQLAQSKQRKQTPVALEDMLKPSRSRDSSTPSLKETKHLLLGNPGSGKTSVSQSFANGWATGRLGQEFDAVYLLSVRDLTNASYDDAGPRKAKTLATAIANSCFGRDDFLAPYEALKRQIKDDLEKTSTLLIVDGLDEGDETGSTLVRDATVQNCSVLLTSRPYNVSGIRPLVGVEMECLGLSDDQLFNFVKREVPDRADDLLKYPKTMPSIWDIAHVPITAGILCSLWNDRKEIDALEKTIGRSRLHLYERMVNFMWQRYVNLKCIGKPPYNREKVFDALKKIAFHAREKGQILISKDLVVEHAPDGNDEGVIRDSGFLLFRLEGIQYQFPHLSFQEFFIGWFLAEILFGNDSYEREKALEFIAKNKYKEVHWDSFAFMMQAACMIRGDEALEKILSIIDQHPRDVVGVQHTFLMLRMIEAYLSVKEDQVDKANCPSICMETVQLASRILVKLICFERYSLFFDRGMSDMLIRHTKQLPNLMRTYPELIIPISELPIETLNDEQVHFITRLGCAIRCFEQSFWDLLLEAYRSFFRHGSYEKTLSNLIEPASNIPEFVLDVLNRASCDQHDGTRCESVRALGPCIMNRPRQAGRLWQLLGNGLADPDADVRRESICQIADIVDCGADLAMTAWDLMTQSTSEEDSTSLLDRACNDDDPYCRRVTSTVLINFACALDDQSMELQNKIAVACSDSSQSVRRQVAERLTKLARSGKGNAKFAWSLLLQCLKDSYEKIRREAVKHMFEVAKVVSVHETEVQEMLTLILTWDDDKNVRSKALEQLAARVTDGTECSELALDALEQACSDKDLDIRHQAWEQLVFVGEISPGMREAVVIILKNKCNDEDDEVRSMAIESCVMLSLLVGFETEAAFFLTLGDADRSLRIREEMARLRHRLPKSEDETRVYKFERLLKRWIIHGDTFAQKEMMRIEGMVEDLAKHKIEAAIRFFGTVDGDKLERLLEVLLKLVFAHTHTTKEIPPWARLFIEMIAKFHSMGGGIIEELKKLVYATPIKFFFDYYLASFGIISTRALSMRILNSAVTVSPFPNCIESDLIFYEGSEEDHFIRNTNEVHCLVSAIKSDLPNL